MAGRYQVIVHAGRPMTMGRPARWFRNLRAAKNWLTRVRLEGMNKGSAYDIYDTKAGRTLEEGTLPNPSRKPFSGSRVKRRFTVHPQGTYATWKSKGGLRTEYYMIVDNLSGRVWERGFLNRPLAQEQANLLNRTLKGLSNPGWIKVSKVRILRNPKGRAVAVQAQVVGRRRGNPDYWFKSGYDKGRADSTRQPFGAVLPRPKGVMTHSEALNYAARELGASPLGSAAQRFLAGYISATTGERRFYK